MNGIEQRMIQFGKDHPDYGFLIRTVEDRGWFVHMHSEPILDGAGRLLGFKHSYRYFGRDLVAGWDSCLAQVIGSKVQ